VIDVSLIVVMEVLTLVSTINNKQQSVGAMVARSQVEKKS